MKASKKQLNQINEFLNKKGLEITLDKFTNNANCFCIELNSSETKQYEMRRIREAINTLPTFQDVLSFALFEFTYPTDFN